MIKSQNQLPSDRSVSSKGCTSIPLYPSLVSSAECSSQKVSWGMRSLKTPQSPKIHGNCKFEPRKSQSNQQKKPGFGHTIWHHSSCPRQCEKEESRCGTLQGDNAAIWHWGRQVPAQGLPHSSTCLIFPSLGKLLQLDFTSILLSFKKRHEQFLATLAQFHFLLAGHAESLSSSHCTLQGQIKEPSLIGPHLGHSWAVLLVESTP